jgi:AcrR family transcriptional regulator
MNKRDTILKTMLHLVNKEGFYHLNMKRLAKEAGISVGTTYLYFDSKEKLINELYKKIVQDFQAVIMKGYQEGRAFKINFNEMLGNALGFYVQNIDCFSFIEQYTYSPFLFKETQDENFAILEPLQKIIKEAKKKKEVKDLPESLLVALSHGPVTSMMKLFVAGKVNLTNKKLRAQIIDACWLSVKL